jgi:hypothetical protein
MFENSDPAIQLANKDFYSFLTMLESELPDGKNRTAVRAMMEDVSAAMELVPVETEQEVDPRMIIAMTAAGIPQDQIEKVVAEMKVKAEQTAEAQPQILEEPAVETPEVSVEVEPVVELDETAVEPELLAESADNEFANFLLLLESKISDADTKIKLLTLAESVIGTDSVEPTDEEKFIGFLQNLHENVQSPEWKLVAKRALAGTKAIVESMK